MELRTDVPLPRRHLNYLDKVCVRIDANTLHACSFILFLIVVVELVTVAMALSDKKTLSPLPL
jgi:hypothetical protein